MITARSEAEPAYTPAVTESTAAPDALKAITLPLLAVFASLLAAQTAAVSLADRSDATARAIAAVVGTATLLALGYALFRRLPAHRRRMAARGGAHLAAVGLAIGCGLALLAATIVASLSTLDDGARERLEEVAFELPDSPLLVLATAVAVVVLAPLGEELVFRALLMRELAGRIGALGAVVVSAAIFTAAHGDAWFAWPRAVALFALGVGFALVYRRLGLPAAIAAHAAVNLSAVIFVVVQD